MLNVAIVGYYKYHAVDSFAMLYCYSDANKPRYCCCRKMLTSNGRFSSVAQKRRLLAPTNIFS